MAGPMTKLIQCRWQCPVMLANLRYPLGRGSKVPASTVQCRIPTDSLFPLACPTAFAILTTLFMLASRPRRLKVPLLLAFTRLRTAAPLRQSRTAFDLLRILKKVSPLNICCVKTCLVTEIALVILLLVVRLVHPLRSRVARQAIL